MVPPLRIFLKNSPYGVAFAPLRLGENLAFSFRRRFSQRRKDAKAAKGRFLLWRDAVTNHPCPPYSPLPHPGDKLYSPCRDIRNSTSLHGEELPMRRNQ